MFTSFESDADLRGETFAVNAPRTPPREPHTLPESGARHARRIGRRVRAQEDAWAMHANAANGFGAGETGT